MIEISLTAALLIIGFAAGILVTLAGMTVVMKKLAATEFILRVLRGDFNR